MNVTPCVKFLYRNDNIPHGVAKEHSSRGVAKAQDAATGAKALDAADAEDADKQAAALRARQAL
jgi:hypothetical protein